MPSTTIGRKTLLKALSYTLHLLSKKANINSQTNISCNFVSVEACLHPAWVDNGYCDDANNYAICNYDGGDCCGSCVNIEYCTECLCHSNETISMLDSNGARYIGNGFCDDGLNKAECSFDGGDCCSPTANMDHCTVCQCLLES